MNVKVQGIEYNSLDAATTLTLSTVIPFKAKMSCKHGYIGDAKMLYLFRNISWLSFTQSLMNVCVLIWRVVI